MYTNEFYLDCLQNILMIGLCRLSSSSSSCKCVVYMFLAKNIHNHVCLCVLFRSPKPQEQAFPKKW